MKNIRRLLGVILTLALIAGVIGAVPLTAYADEELPYTAYGSCGVGEDSDVEWFAFNDKSMAIFGTGAIRDYTYNGSVSTAPWYGSEFATIAETLFVTKIAVEYGITRIGDYSFYIDDRYPYKAFVQLNNIDIANTVTSIGKYAFYGQKFEEVIIPPGVTHIGENAFKNSSLRSITYYGDPEHLTWDRDGENDTEFSRTMIVHILSDYESKRSSLNTQFAYKHIEFVADLDNPYAASGEDLDRNIGVYYGAANSHVFGGAAPYVIVGRFDGKKKSVTHGSNGFASCVKIGSEYYVLTNSSTGELHRADINSLSGKLQGYDAEPLEGVTLKITHEYIGVNTVKMIYTLTTTSNISETVKIGGTGDIKIGADDFAAIEPLYEEVGGSQKQVGFYMKSTKEFDKSSSGDYATLGFIGKNVKVDNSDPSSATYDDSNFFYGTVSAAKGTSAAGSKTMVLMPERIFDTNPGVSHETGSFDEETDSGMSYYWEESSLSAGTKQYAVLFSVYGTNDEEHSAESMIEDLSETFYTVTWNDDNGNTLVKQVVKYNDIPVYPGATPTKESTAQYDYRFIGWSPELSAVTSDTTYTAQYEQTERKFFKKHSLSLDGDIGVNYYIDVTAAGLSVNDVKNGTKRVRLKFDWYNKSAEYPADSSSCISAADYDANSGLFKAKCSVCAAEMAYNIHTTAYIDGEEYTREHDDFSVRAYGDVVLDESSAFSTTYKAENPEKYAQLKDLVVKMLDYGSKAQVVFDRIPNDLANKNFSTLGVRYAMQYVTLDMIDAAVEPRSDMHAGIGDVGLKYAGSSVVYLSSTSLRHYYTVENASLFTDEIRDGASFTYHEKEPGLYFEMTDIPAAELDKPQIFTIGGKSYSFSVLNYSRSVLNSKLSREEKYLAMATYWYSGAANSFFGV